MFKNIAPINFEANKNTKIKSITNFNFVKETHLASVMVHEFAKCAPIYPIVFLEDKTKDQFRPVALLGLEDGENLFVDGDKWQASYIPAIVRRYPFVLAGSEGSDRFTICLDKDSEFVNETEGQPLFDDNGKPSESLERVKTYLQELQQMELFTAEFVKYLAEKNMFTPLNMKLRIGKEVKDMSGAYIINEERLNNLSDEVYLELRNKRYLPVIYSHLASLGQMERLVSFKDKSIAVTESVQDRF